MTLNEAKRYLKTQGYTVIKEDISANTYDYARDQVNLAHKIFSDYWSRRISIYEAMKQIKSIYDRLCEFQKKDKTNITSFLKEIYEYYCELRNV